MKKIISVISAFILLFTFLSFDCFAEEQPALDVRAVSAVLMDASTGQILWKLNENEKVYPASVTKIMPLLLFMEALDSGKISLEDKVTASSAAASKGGSQIWLKEGETMTVNELLKATAIASANDACCALGEYISGSEEAFVKRMNERAAQLGMTGTTFENCSGLDDDTVNHFTSAKDVAIMSRELLKHEKITEYTTVWMDTLRNGETQLVNTNKLVRFYEGTTGLKTGTTSKAGHCLSASAKRDGLHLIAVIMGAKSSDDRFSSAKALLNWGFANFETVIPKVDSSLFSDVKVIKGVEEYVRPILKSTDPITLKAGQKDKIEFKADISLDVKAPVEKNQTLGKLTLKIGENILEEYNLVSEKAVEKMNLGMMLKRFIKSLSKSL